MASTAIPDSEITEFRDSKEELEGKIQELAKLVREAAGNFVVYTGAGISTNAGIPDFRGPNGVWTLRAKGLDAPRSSGEAKPTLCHMALVGLMQGGYLSYLVSQNCDGLHLRSGVPPRMISELHGNSNAEACPDCGEVYWRPERVRSGPNEHCLTGRSCRKSGCKGQLRYTTVAFGQSMPDLALQRAEQHSRTSLLSLTMGTSMRVQPACELPGLAKKRSKGKSGKLVIVNYQKTPYDHLCDIRIFADCDEVMLLLCRELALEIPDRFDLKEEQDMDKLRAWYAQFKQDWAFRSPDPTYTWCSPKKQKSKQLLPVVRPAATSALSSPAGPATSGGDEDRGGYVEPKRDCPHIAACVSSDSVSVEAASCMFNEGVCGESGCGRREELWMCLNCLSLHCGRFQLAHSLHHSTKDPCCLCVISLGDLNTWCYACDAYVRDDRLLQHYVPLYLAKFGQLPPGLRFKK